MIFMFKIFSKKNKTSQHLWSGTANSLGNCDVDTFTITAPGAKCNFHFFVIHDHKVTNWLLMLIIFISAPPVICGTNTGQHMYVPASDQCNELSAVFGSGSTATTSAYTIKITQVHLICRQSFSPKFWKVFWMKQELLL